MLSAAQKVHHFVREELGVQATNIKVSLTQDLDFKYTQKICDRFFLEIVNDCKRGDLNEEEVNLLEKFFTSIISQFYKKGCCYEQAIICFVKLLEMGIKNSIEIFCINGSPTFKESFSNETNYAYKVHHFVLINRDLKTDPNHLPSLNNFIALDTWREGKVTEYKDNKDFDPLHLTQGLIDPQKYSSFFSIQNNLNEQQWLKLADYLEKKTSQSYSNCD